MEVLGHTFRARGSRTDEMIEVMRQLWETGSAELHGAHFDFPEVHAEPRPEHPIPLYVGGHTPAAIRRAARCDGWMGLDFALEDSPGVVSQLRTALEQEKRSAATAPDAPFEILLSPRVEPSRDLYRALEDMGVTGVILSLIHI